MTALDDLKAAGIAYAVSLGYKAPVAPTPTYPVSGAAFVADGSSLTPWTTNGGLILANPADHIKVVDDPLALRGKVFQFDCADTDQPQATNPRSQAQTGVLAKEGTTNWTAWSLLLPTDFPAAVAKGSWLSLCEWYGAPFDGTGVIPALTVRQEADGTGQRLCWTRGPEHGYDEVVKLPITRNKWIDFAQKTTFTTANTGVVELWVAIGGQAYSKIASVTQQTLRPNNTSGLFFGINNYRERGKYSGMVTVYFDQIRIGSTFDQVRLR